MPAITTPVLLAWVLAVLVLATLIGQVLARTGFALSDSHRTFAEIDGLRGYLALMVMVQHFLIWAHGPPTAPTWTPPPLPFAQELGIGSVAVFFMITGFLFASRIDRGLFATNWAEFAVARFFRLAPLVLVSLLVVELLIHAETGARPVWRDGWTALMWVFGRQEMLPLAGMAEPDLWDAHVLWSLRWEWIFYAAIMPAWAAAITIWPRARQDWRLPSVMVLGCLGTSATCAALGRSVPALAQFLPFFVAGYVVRALVRHERLRRVLGGPIGDGVTVIALIVAMAIWPDPFGWGQLGYAVVFLCVASGAGLGGILRLPGALVLGECSYAIYLFHGLALALLFRWAPALVHARPPAAQPLWLLAATVVVVPATAALHLAVERPLLLQGKRWGRSVGKRFSVLWRGRQETPA